MSENEISKEVEVEDDLDTDSDLDSDLDTSWIEDYEKISSIQQNYIREPMDTIDIYYIYVNTESSIEKIICEKELLHINVDNNDKEISNERVLQLIQTKRGEGKLKYKLMDILLYNVDLESDNIQSFSTCENLKEMSQSFFHILNIFDNKINISPSIFIFHEVNALFFIFKESEKNTKSILKSNISSSHRTTKKVRIQIPEECDEEIEKKNYHRKSLKLLSRIGSRTTRKNDIKS